MSTWEDEFEIKATTKDGAEPHIWTRSTYVSAKIIADQAITKLKYDRAEVVNTYGGDRSDVLYAVDSTGTRSDYVNPDRSANQNSG